MSHLAHAPVTGAEAFLDLAFLALFEFCNAARSSLALLYMNCTGVGGKYI
jgi:hypothetical protein